MVEPSRGPDFPAEALAARPLSQPHPDRLSPNRSDYGEILAAHAEALAGRSRHLRRPGSGLTVLTAGYLASRGYCCGSGCRHCPYVRMSDGNAASWALWSDDP